MPVDTGSLTIGFPRESGAERRTILTPALARQLTDAGFTVIAERGIGSRGVHLRRRVRRRRSLSRQPGCGVVRAAGAALQVP